VPGRAEDLLAEETVLLRLQGAVVDRFGLLDLAVRPLPDVVSGCQADTQLVEEVDVKHLCIPYVAGLCDQAGPVGLGAPPPPGNDLTLPRPTKARASTGRCPVLRPRGRPRRRSPASQAPLRRWRAPRR